MDFTIAHCIPSLEEERHVQHVHRYLAARYIVRRKRVLDIACGDGYGSDLLAETAETVVGVDIDDAVIAHARQTYPRSNIRFLRGDAVAIPLGDASVDVAVSFETIEHLTDRRLMMLEIKRLLAPGGLLIISSRNRREYSECPHHLRELYLSEIHAMLGEHFRNCALYGQRVHYASVIAPTESRNAPFIAYRDDSPRGIVEGIGLPQPVCFIAVASDGPLAELPAGLFIPQQPPFTHDIALLKKELEAGKVFVAEATQRETSLRGELDQCGQRVEELAEQVCQAAGEAEGLRQHVQALEVHSEELGRELLAQSTQGNELRQQLAALEVHRSSVQRESDQRVERIDELLQQFAALEVHRSSVQRESDQRVERIDELLQQFAALEVHRSSIQRESDQRGERIDELLQQFTALHASMSWRLMAPLRIISHRLHTVMRNTYINVALTGRFIYRHLPVRWRKRLSKQDAPPPNSTAG